MALPADFPPAPKRPPATEPIGSPAWLTYFDALDRYNRAVAAILNNLP